jgi:internalin A
LYAKVLKGTGVPDRTTLANAELKLSGLVKRDNQGNLVVRNPVYRRLFDNVWVQSTRPRRALNRTRSYAVAASIALVLLFGGGVGYYINVIQPDQSRLAALDRLAALKISVTDADSGGLKARFPNGTTPELLKTAIPLLKNAGSVTEIEPGNESADLTDRKVPRGFTGEMDDLAPFSGLGQLRSLDLTGLKVKDIGALAALSQLKTLLLGFGYPFQEIDFIARDTEKFPLVDINPLERMKSLERLSLKGTSVSDVGPLASIGGLVALDIGFTDVSDLRPLENLKGLEGLYAASTAVQDLNPLSRIKSLNRLHLKDTKVQDISPISALVELDYLDVSRSNAVDLVPLSGLTKLTTVYLSFVPVENVKPLKGLANLKRLGLFGTRVNDVSPLAGLVELTSLDLTRTPVTNARPLAGLANLRVLFLTGTNIPSEQIKLLRQMLKKAEIYSDDPSISIKPPDLSPRSPANN